jgi:uncharacterized damage-inducible protein DinB
MSTSNDLIVHSLKDSMFMVRRFCEDLKPEEYLHRPAAGANCTAWVIGHLTLTKRSMLERLEVKDLPPLPEGFEKRFSRDEGSPQASEFGDVTTLLPLFEQHCHALMQAVQKSPVEQLDQPLPKPHPLFSTLGEMVNFMALHAALHAGQITIIRRSMGRPPLI